MPPVGFEPTISAGERPQTDALDRAATGTGNKEEILWWGPTMVYQDILFRHFYYRNEENHDNSQSH